MIDYLNRVIFLVLFLSPIILFSNNLQLQNTNIASVNAAQQFAMIEFDISWENSWRDATNYDAVWVFIKFREPANTGDWQHATLNYVNGVSDGHTAPTNATINTPSDGKGVFIFRGTNGNGNVNFLNAQLRWNYGIDGVSNTANVDIKVLGIEMVYVPQGSFYVGDGQTTSNQIYGNFEEGTTGNPLQITSEGVLTLGGGSVGSLGNNNHINTYDNQGSCSGCLLESQDDFDDVTSQTLPAAFPKGYVAFYCMKYELSQQQFTDMLNCLTSTQVTNLSTTSHFHPNYATAVTLRYGISNSGQPFTNSEPQLPMIYFDWIRAAAYSDWSALRPMTELEFEKACRGTASAVVNEYPWGNANIDLSANLTLNNQGLINEGVASGYNSGGTDGNCWINGGSHNMNVIARGGIFAAHVANTSRVSSGGSFYGIMDLGGNCWERCVSVGESDSRNFTGSHGDGVLHANGFALQSDWPGNSSGVVDSNVGVGYRGGGMAFPSPNIDRNARVSSRRCASAYYNAVINDDGARFVRTAE